MNGEQNRSSYQHPSLLANNKEELVPLKQPIIPEDYGNAANDNTPTSDTGSDSNNNTNMNDNSNTSKRSSSSGNNNYKYKKGQQRIMSRKERWMSRISIGASLLSIILCIVVLIGFAIGIYKASKNDNNNSNSNNNNNSTDYNNELNMRERLDGYANEFYDINGRYILEDYDIKSPFSDFLPGLAGYYGKPMYVFFVNRGQGIASFGFKSKDYPIQEFHSANIAYQQTPFTGFRTFIQISSNNNNNKKDNKNNNNNIKVIEPFSALTSRFADQDVTSTISDNDNNNIPKRYMYIGSNEMRIQEIDYTNGIETNVTFFVLPEEDFGAFVKRTTITNIRNTKSSSSWRGNSNNNGGGNTITISMLDGLTKIEPAGGKMNNLLKMMGRTLEAWKGVYSPYDDTIQMPYYRLSSQPSDTAAVTIQQAGHWCLSILEETTESDKIPEPILLPIIHDPSKIFGDDTTFLRPVHLYDNSIMDIINNEKQYGAAKTASAFSAINDITIQPNESITVSTYFGMSDDILDVPVIVRRLIQPGFASFKERRAQELIEQITASVDTKTANRLFDGHVKQMFLDNSLRGGVPSVLGEIDDDAKLRNADEDQRIKPFSLFSRKHGDLERDYNDFVIEPTFFSNGPGNFRDVVQNRRNDVLFNPKIGSFNIKHFLSFIQADGYNPLTVEAVVFTIDDVNTCQQIARHAVGEADGHRAQREALYGILNAGPFRPGQLFLLMEKQNIDLIISRQEFIDIVAASAKSYPMAVFNDGYWADHWTYYLDLIEAYLRIYPDWEKRIMFDESLPYFFSPAYVEPRERKYVLSVSYDGQGHHVRQLNATSVDDSDEMAYQSQFIRNETGWYDLQADWQHDKKGKLFHSSPMEKLFLLATIKFATRDPYGVGISYEGGKPGWNDANNGLVGMIGSGAPELYELYALLQYIVSSIDKYKQNLNIPSELYQLVKTINESIDNILNDYVDGQRLYPRVPKPLFVYWDTVSTALERYRAETKITFSGDTNLLEYDYLVPMLHKWINQVELGIARGQNLGTYGDGDDGSMGIPPSYFSYNVTRWQETGAVNGFGHSYVRAREMEVSLFPLFLEGPTRMMKTVRNRSEALNIYDKVKNSPLRDENLKMYLISASLKGQSFDMGREMAFPPGWLENESVWLHMSYKFYLELLKHELYDEFFQEMSSGGMLPYMDPQIYGRSLLECSSFIASSAFEDPSIHGRGYLARLSGSTSEFLSMWTLMMIGPNPFYLDGNGRLRMQLIPALPRWMFDNSTSTTDGNTDGNDNDNGIPKVSFKLFGSIDVTYYHERDDDLFHTKPSMYIVKMRDSTVYHTDGPSLDSELADKIRRIALVASIDVYFD